MSLIFGKRTGLLCRKLNMEENDYVGNNFFECSYFYRRNSAFMPGNYGAVHIQDVSGDKTQTPFHYSRDE